TGATLMSMSNSVGPTILNISGGTFTSQTCPMTLGTRGTATLNISGTAVVTLPTLQIGNSASTAGTKTANLLGGTLVVGTITNGNTGTTTNLNFNGGTLQAASSTSSLIATNLSAINVRNGGAILDTKSFNVTVAAALRHSAIGGDNAIDGGLAMI